MCCVDRRVRMLGLVNILEGFVCVIGERFAVFFYYGTVRF